MAKRSEIMLVAFLVGVGLFAFYLTYVKKDPEEPKKASPSDAPTAEPPPGPQPAPASPPDPQPAPPPAATPPTAPPNKMRSVVTGEDFDLGRTKSLKTASFIWSKKENGEILCAFARKCHRGQRLRHGAGSDIKSSGAAKTQKEVWGRWTTFGGSKDNETNRDYTDALQRIVDDGAMQSRGVGFEQLKRELKLVDAKIDKRKNGENTIFIWKMELPLFIKLFPEYPFMKYGANFVEESHGEIDAVASFTLDEVFRKSKSFAPYVIDSYANYFLKYLQSTNHSVTIPIFEKQHGEMVPHRNAFRYVEIAENKYVGTCPFTTFSTSEERATKIQNMGLLMSTGENARITNHTLRSGVYKPYPNYFDICKIHDQDFVIFGSPNHEIYFKSSHEQFIKKVLGDPDISKRSLCNDIQCGKFKTHLKIEDLPVHAKNRYMDILIAALGKFDRLLHVSGQKNICYQIAAVYAMLIHEDTSDEDRKNLKNIYGQTYSEIARFSNLTHKGPLGETGKLFLRHTGVASDTLKFKSRIDIIELVARKPFMEPGH